MYYNSPGRKQACFHTSLKFLEALSTNQTSVWGFLLNYIKSCELLPSKKKNNRYEQTRYWVKKDKPVHNNLMTTNKYLKEKWYNWFAIWKAKICGTIICNILFVNKEKHIFLLHVQ